MRSTWTQDSVQQPLLDHSYISAILLFLLCPYPSCLGPRIILYSVINISWQMSRGRDLLQFVPFSLWLSPTILTASRHLPGVFLGTSAPTARLLLMQGQKDVAFRQGNVEVEGLLCFQVLQQQGGKKEQLCSTANPGSSSVLPAVERYYLQSPF